MDSYEDEFKKILAAYPKLYIFGAGEVAARICKLIMDYDGSDARIQGIVVSKKEYLASAVVQYKNMHALEDIRDLDTPFLVTVNRVYHPEVFALLEQKGAKIIEGHKFFMLESNSHQADDIADAKLFALVEKDKLQLSAQELRCREKIIELRLHNNHAFGGKGFYQSFPRLCIDGMRPTDKRIQQYGLVEYLSHNADVLDIGSNAGFLDMEIASSVRTVLGVEYNKTLADVANAASKMLEINNASFVCDDYNHWKNTNNKCYNVVFSFAVHVWLGISPESYAEDIYDLLADGGIFLFESHDVKTDKKYDAYCEKFINKGLIKISEGCIVDNGITERRYMIFRK